MARWGSGWGLVWGVAFVWMAGCNGPEGALPVEGIVPEADAGTTPDGGSSGGEPDGGTPEGGAGDDCAGLTLTAPGAPVTFRVPLGDFETATATPFCSPGTSDGEGHLGLSLSQGQRGSRDYVVAPDGGLVKTFDGRAYRAWGQASGFLGLQHGSGSSWLTALSHAGEVTKQTEEVVGVAMDAENPLGGLVTFGQGLGQLISYDAAGNVRWARAIPDDYGLVVLAVERQGWTLLLRSVPPPIADPLQGRWIDPTGTVGGPFPVNVAGRFHRLALFPRVGGGLFLQGGDGTHVQWIAAIDAGATVSSPPPEWLVARPDHTLHMARAGRAYVMLPIPSSDSADCAAEIEVVAPSGQSCGKAQLRAAEGACFSHPLGVGYDGTVMQMLPEGSHCDQTGNHCPCAWQFWPGLVR